MTDFLIQCALCAVNFKNEKEYDHHKCKAAEAADIKMEPVEPVEKTTDYTEVDPSVKKFQARMKRFAAQKIKKKKQRRRSLVTTPFIEPTLDAEEEEEDTSPSLSLRQEKVKEEPVEEPEGQPIELCEVVHVKDEPMEVEGEETEAQDPLANMGDILGLEDEDYLIENFVEYDAEASEGLEIDESADEELNSVKNIIDDVNAAALALSHPKKVNPNVGKRIEFTTNKGYECNVCHRRFFLKSKLEEHLLNSHKSPRPYSCEVCGKKFTHKNYVTLHMRVHTGEKPYKCTLCDRSYSHKTSFTIHMRIHKGERPYECTVCGKKCYDKSGLTSHMRSHTKETPYQCECCGRKFTHSKSLLVHRRNHTGEKPYVCPHCGRAFRHWHKHKIHIRLHTGERPYKCKVCNKGFPRNDEVKRHMKSHIGIKSFRCSICGVYCATQASITGHINLHHVNLTTDKKFLPDKTIVENSQSGILGKKIEYQPSEHRIYDTTSYEQFPDRPPSSADTPIKTIVTSRPMTSAEKVTNKSMTYRQFLNDQEQQLLAKGLKVVSKNGNTYGLEKIDGKDSDTESKDNVKLSLDNVFVKVNNIKRNTPTAPRTTRIILPNLGKSKIPVMLGEEPSKLLLQSVDTAKTGEKVPLSSADNSSSTSQQPSVLIQTCGKNMSISPPMVVGRSNSNSSKAGQQKNQSILHAALTTNQPAAQSKGTSDIIVLNKGVSGAPSSTQAPLVMLSPQPTQQTHQLLLLPGINGAPARLVILQSNQPVIKLENNSAQTPLLSPPTTSGVVVKKEPGEEQDGTKTEDTTTDTLHIKEEPKDMEDSESQDKEQVESILPNDIKKEIDELELLDLPMTRIKTEPAD